MIMTSMDGKGGAPHYVGGKGWSSTRLPGRERPPRLLFPGGSPTIAPATPVMAGVFHGRASRPPGSVRGTDFVRAGWRLKPVSCRAARVWAAHSAAIFLFLWSSGALRMGRLLLLGWIYVCDPFDSSRGRAFTSRVAASQDGGTPPGHQCHRRGAFAR